jgi:hypothetical protein
VKVDHNARKREGVPPLEAVLPPHQLEHPVDRLRRRLVEILVEPEREPGAVDPSDRVLELDLSERERQARACHRRLDRKLAHLAVPLPRVAVAGREQRSIDRHRKVERRPLAELRAVDVPAPAPRRLSRVDARLRRRHPHHAEERPQRNHTAELVASGPRVGVELPDERLRLPVRHTEPLVQRRLPAAGTGHAPRTDPQLVDVHRERATGDRTAHLDRAEQRMARIQFRVPWPEPLPRAGGVRRRSDSPAGVG